MARIGFVGATYQSQSLNTDAQDAIELMVETDESGSGKSAASLVNTPGLAPWCGLTINGKLTSATRGAIAINALGVTRVFFVADGQLFEVFADKSFIARGGVANDEQPSSLACSPLQVMVASGGNAYVYDLTANTLTAIAALAGIPIVQVGYSDGFFQALQKNSQTFYVSAPVTEGGATSWDLTNFGTVSVFPDTVLAMLVDHREVWLFGATRSTAYYDSGGANFPYDVVPGGFLELGIAAPASAVRADNSPFWIGADERGGGIAWRATGYQPQRVSTHAVEAAWNNYPTIADAVGYSYQEGGHTFVQWTFPSANVTWVYDVAAPPGSQWHKRAFWDAKDGVYTAHRSICHVYAWGKHLVGDWATGNVYQQAMPQSDGAGGWLFCDHFGNAIRRLRAAPYVSNELKWIRHNELIVDGEVGLGPAQALTGPVQNAANGLTLADATGALWTVTVLDNGTDSIVAAAAGAVAQTAILNDSATATTSWKLGVTTGGGALNATQVTFGAQYKQLLAVATSPSQKQSYLSVSALGVVTITPPYAAPRGPQICLQWSDNAGRSWSNEHWVDFGQEGEYLRRARWSRLGRSRHRIYRVIMTDPVPWRFADAYLNAPPTYQTTERLSAQLRKGA